MVSKNSLGKKILTYLVIVIALAAFIFPIYWMFIASFKENSILMRVPPQLYPTFKTIDNYISIITNTKYLNYIKNSFVIISDTDDTFNFVVSILYTQLFNLLCDKADDVYGGRLPVHVRCLLDEFANIGQIPKFEKAHSDHAKPRNIGFYYFAITVAAKGNLQGQRRYHSRQLRHDPFLGRQGKNDAQRNIGNLRQRND